VREEEPEPETEPMNDNPQRVEEFKTAIADMKLRDPSTKSERQWLMVGYVLIVAAIVISIYTYIQSGKEEQLEQNELLSLGLVSIVLSLTGIALFLRYSFGRLMRFWLVRVVYEMRASDPSRDDEPTPVA
jgi:hypothetical protein